MSDPALHRMTDLVRDMMDIMGDGLIGVDLVDIKTVLSDNGRGAIGIGEASGPGRAVEAARLAMADLERNYRAGHLGKD